MNSEKNRVERILHLNLEVTDDFICVTSIEGESGETYCMDFGRDRKPEQIMMRVGLEVWSWLSMMTDELNRMKQEGETA